MPRLSVWMVRAALLHLGTGFTFGALMLWNKGVPLDARLWRLWPLHVEVMLIGWMVQLAMGVAYWILPRFSGERKYGRFPWLAWVALGLLNGGVIAACAGQWFSGVPTLTLAGRISELLAVAAYAIYLWPRVKPLGGQTAAGNSPAAGRAGPSSSESRFHT